jgi:4-aminobutyrate aminotransferase-like enzyme/Ser/Thr protein kinase RdoA (MazF antagonist)
MPLVFLGMDRTTWRAQADPLETPPPRFSLEEAEAISRHLFGVIGSASPLDSERDQNFRVVSEDGRSFLLKISNRADDLGALEMQTRAMLHIGRQDPGLPVMQPLPTLEEGFHGDIEGADGDKHLVRLFSFLPGAMTESRELGPEALHGFGAMVARMGLALRSFFDPAGGYSILWDLKHTPDLRPLLDTIADGARRGVVERVLDRFDERAGVWMPRLRAQVIHNDLTLDNVLLDDVHRVSGIVDFGDLTHTALICDLAIALVSLMWGRSDPLEASRWAIAGYTSAAPIEDLEADVLGDLVSARLAALVLIANWRVRSYPDNAAYITANEEIAWELLEHFDALGLPEVESELRAACLRRPPPSMTRARPRVEELLERRRRVLGPALAPLSYDRPLYLVRGEGSHMFDHEGTAYLDAYNNVPVVGHCHPRVTTAIAEQSGTLNTNTRYLHDSVVELAERLVATMPPGLDTVMFLNSGSEANDVAWRLAAAHTGGSGGIVTAFAYHGVTSATIALSPEEWPKGEEPTHIATVPAPDGYRGAHRREQPGWSERYAACVDDAVTRLESRGVRPAAFFVDSAFTSDGIFAPPAAYLHDVIRRVHEAGCLFVADEVQCGFGRSGSHLWSFESSGITPDLVTLGKPMGNGYPVAAVVTRSEIADRFASKTDMFSTFGGNPVAARAALAVLDVLEEAHLKERADVVGRRLRASLEALARRHSSVGDVRGTGLLIGVELVRDRRTREPAPRLTQTVMNRMKERGVLVGSTGREDNVLKIRPPLVLSDEEADAISETLEACLGELGGLEGVEPGEART